MHVNFSVISFNRIQDLHYPKNSRKNVPSALFSKLSPLFFKPTIHYKINVCRILTKSLFPQPVFHYKNFPYKFPSLLKLTPKFSCCKNCGRPPTILVQYNWVKFILDDVWIVEREIGDGVRVQVNVNSTNYFCDL